MDDFLKYALDYGAVGIMAYIFFWLYLKQQKRIDQMLIEQKEEEEKIRNRWTAVIEKYDEEKTNLTKERLESLVKLKNEVYNLKELNQNQEKLLINMIEELKLLKTEISIQNRKKEGC
jgi:hypothetical protein